MKQEVNMRTFEEIVMEVFAGEISEGDSYNMEDTHMAIQDIADIGDIHGLIEQFKEAAFQWKDQFLKAPVKTIDEAINYFENEKTSL